MYVIYNSLLLPPVTNVKEEKWSLALGASEHPLPPLRSRVGVETNLNISRVHPSQGLISLRWASACGLVQYDSKPATINYCLCSCYKRKVCFL